MSRSPSTTHEWYILLRWAPSSPLKEDQKNYLKPYNVDTRNAEWIISTK